MTATERAIRDAQKSGWYAYVPFDFKYISHGFIEEVVNGEITDDLAERDKISIPEILLDPDFWRCLGIVRGWSILACVRCRKRAVPTRTKDTDPEYWEVCCTERHLEYELSPIIYWHRLIDALASGKSAEDFFISLEG